MDINQIILDGVPLFAIEEEEIFRARHAESQAQKKERETNRKKTKQRIQLTKPHQKEFIQDVTFFYIE